MNDLLPSSHATAKKKKKVTCFFSSLLLSPTTTRVLPSEEGQFWVSEEAASEKDIAKKKNPNVVACKRLNIAMSSANAGGQTDF